MKTQYALATFLMTLITACGGGGGADGTGFNASSTDPSTQLVLSSIQQKALDEKQEASSGDSAAQGIERNAQVLSRTVLNKP